MTDMLIAPIPVAPEPIAAPPTATLQAALTQAPLTPRDTRVTTILLVARLVTETCNDLCRIRNLSSSGMRIETLAPIATSEHVGIELKNGAAVRGVVMWTKGGEMGVRFTEPVEIVDLLANGRLPPRSLRMTTECPAMLRRNGYIGSGVLQDISPGGAKVTQEAPAYTGDAVMLSIPGLKPRRGIVRWADGGTFGLAYAETMAFAELSRWLASEHRFSSAITATLIPPRQSS